MPSSASGTASIEIAMGRVLEKVKPAGMVAFASAGCGAGAQAAAKQQLARKIDGIRPEGRYP